MTTEAHRARERHRRAARHAAEEGCVCSGPRPRWLCGAEHTGMTCTRRFKHAGLHVACAGELGPHAIASWGTAAEAEADA